MSVGPGSRVWLASIGGIAAVSVFLFFTALYFRYVPLPTMNQNAGVIPLWIDLMGSFATRPRPTTEIRQLLPAHQIKCRLSVPHNPYPLRRSGGTLRLPRRPALPD